MQAQIKANRLGLGALALGHMVVDMQTSSLAIMIPLLYANFKLDYASAALIITLNSITSSFIQPIFGVLSDRKSLRWLLPLGCLVASFGIVLVLYMPSYWLVLLVVMISGLGSAAYHPEGSRNANYVSGSNKATGVSFFFVGGNLGFTLGPIFATIMLALFGQNGILALIIPGIIGSIVLWKFLPLYAEYAAVAKIQRAARLAATQGQPSERRGVVGMMSLLLSIISVRAVIQTGMITFIPLYFATLPGDNKQYAAFLLSVFLFCGAIGTLMGGRLADKFGSKAVMVGSMILVTPLMLLFLNSSGVVQVVSLGIAGAALISASSLTVVMAQATMPNNIGLASGLTLGLGFGAGGLGAAALGKLADVSGISLTMVIVAFLPILIIALSLLMPSQKSRTIITKTGVAQPQAEALIAPGGD